MSRSIRFAAGLLAFTLFWPAYAIAAPGDPVSLIGTELRLRVVWQPSPTGAQQVANVTAHTTVSSDDVEFPNLGKFDVSGDHLVLLNISINAGNNFIEVDFDNAQPLGQFSAAYENTYVLTFTGSVPIELRNAAIDKSATNLGLTEDRVYVRGNELVFNVQGLKFDKSTFARIRFSAVESDGRAPAAGAAPGAGRHPVAASQASPGTSPSSHRAPGGRRPPTSPTDFPVGSNPADLIRQIPGAALPRGAPSSVTDLLGVAIGAAMGGAGSSQPQGPQNAAAQCSSQAVAKVDEFVRMIDATARLGLKSGRTIACVELNRRAPPEALVILKGSHNCGAQGCAGFALDLSESQAVNVGDFIATTLEPLPTHTNGWRDLSLNGKRVTFQNYGYQPE